MFQPYKLFFNLTRNTALEKLTTFWRPLEMKLVFSRIFSRFATMIYTLQYSMDNWVATCVFQHERLNDFAISVSMYHPLWSTLRHILTSDDILRLVGLLISLRSFHYLLLATLCGRNWPVWSYQPSSHPSFRHYNVTYVILTSDDVISTWNLAY